MKDDFNRSIKEKYGEGETSFTDGFPFMVVSLESLDLLNSKLGKALSVSRCRPNVVVSVSEPHEEDTWTKLKVGTVNFRGVKLCSRCKITTIQPLTGWRRAINNAGDLSKDG